MKKSATMLCLAMIASLAASGLTAEEKTKPAAKQKIAASGKEVNFQIEIEAKYKESTGSLNFVVQDGQAASQLAGGEKQIASGENKNEFKKWGFLCNILPVSAGNDKKVYVQLQVELSGPSKSPLAGNFDIETWQLQTEVNLVKGEKTVIAQSPGRVEITVTELK